MGTAGIIAYRERQLEPRCYVDGEHPCSQFCPIAQSVCAEGTIVDGRPYARPSIDDDIRRDSLCMIIRFLVLRGSWEVRRFG